MITHIINDYHDWPLLYFAYVVDITETESCCKPGASSSVLQYWHLVAEQCSSSLLTSRAAALSWQAEKKPYS